MCLINAPEQPPNDPGGNPADKSYCRQKEFAQFAIDHSLALLVIFAYPNSFDAVFFLTQQFLNVVAAGVEVFHVLLKLLARH